MSLVIRVPRPEEAEAALAVNIARDIADSGKPDYTLDDIHTDWTTPDIDAWVAEEHGALVATAVLDPRGGMLCVHPEAEGRGVGIPVREAVEARARERGMDTVRLHVAATDEVARAQYAEAGYSIGHHFVKLCAERDELPECPPEVPGLRTLRLGEEDRELYELISLAFSQIPGDIPTSYEMFRAEGLDRPCFAFDLSFAADDEQGLCGAVLSERREGAGYVADLAVHPRAQGRGLGRGLLLTALAAIRAAGLEAGELWVNGANAPALGLYESAGLREVNRGERWERPL